MKLHRYVEQQRLHITTKDRPSYLSSSWVIRPWLIWKMFLTCSSFAIWNIWMKLHRYVDHQRLHIVTKDVISLSISVLLLFRHYISHKITFGAPSSGGVLCSACGAFIIYGIKSLPDATSCDEVSYFKNSFLVTHRKRIDNRYTTIIFKRKVKKKHYKQSRILHIFTFIFLMGCKFAHRCTNIMSYHWQFYDAKKILGSAYYKNCLVKHD